MTEIWKWIPGFEGLYEVSDLGRARSYHKGLRPVAPGPHPGGYLMLHLYKDGKRTARTVHHCVMSAFVGPRPNGMQVCHRDNDKTNNRRSNLRYGTASSNNADKKRHGTHLQGEAHPTSKLTAVEVAEIRRARGRPQQDLADEYGITFSNVSAIQLRKSWRHVR